ARIIFAQRDPRDVALSCYFQSFALVGAMPYFLDLESTASYYDTVMGLATEAQEALPLRVHTVRYESLVTDFENQARALVDFLGLPWDEGVLAYRDRLGNRAISTPSYQQVAEPLYQRSSGRWRHYARQLEPVRPVLDPWAERFGYAVEPPAPEPTGG
ncbi:MAG: sulfotransferase, partial [Gammaproteobacteria bacterium]